MTTYRNYLLASLAVAVLAPQAWAEKEVIVRRLDVDGPHQAGSLDRGLVEKQKVAFLGIMTAPVDRTLSSQLGLPRDTGLVVGDVVEKSPAAEFIRRDDVLTKLDDQILINPPQLSVLVRSRKEGDEVRLTLLREGKELNVKVKLGAHEIEVFKGGHPMLAPPGRFGGDFDQAGPEDMGPGLDRIGELPGMDPGEARDVLRMIQHERGNFVAGPGLHIRRRGDLGVTILDLPKSNITYSDDEGSIEIKVTDDRRTLTVKNTKGEVAFAGPITTEDDRKKLPPEVLKRLGRLESDSFNFEVGDDFKPDMVPLAPEPARTKISLTTDRDEETSAEHTPRPF